METGNSLQPTQAPSSPPDYSAPSRSDLAAVAATVSVVGVIMAILLTWLFIRLRRAEADSQHLPITHRPTSNASYIFRPSFAPSEASSRFGFIRKPLRLTRRQENTSWDFTDPDPFNARPEDNPDVAHPPKQRPPPLKLAPAYTPPSPRARRNSTHKDEFWPRTPTTPGTPASMDFVEPPPPAYCRDGVLSPVHQSMTKDRSPP